MGPALRPHLKHLLPYMGLFRSVAHNFTLHLPPPFCVPSTGCFSGKGVLPFQAAACSHPPASCDFWVNAAWVEGASRCCDHAFRVACAGKLPGEPEKSCQECGVPLNKLMYDNRAQKEKVWGGMQDGRGRLAPGRHIEAEREPEPCTSPWLLLAGAIHCGQSSQQRSLL